MVKNYTGHEYDQVLGMYYAKARFYAPELRRFLSMDPVKGSVMDPISIVQYLYVKNGPLVFIDPLGEYYIVGTIRNGKLESYRLIDEELGDSLVMAVNAAIGNEYTDTLIYTVQRTAGIIGGTSAMDLSAATVFSDAKSFWELLSGQKVNWGKLVERVTNQAIGAAQVNRKIRQLQAIKASKLGTVFGVIYASYNFLKSISESIDRAKFDAPFLDFAEELGIVSGQNVTLDELKKRIDVLTKFIEDENKSYYFRDCFFDLYCWNSTPGAEHRGAGVQDIETSSMWLLGYMASQGRTVYEHFLDNSEPNPELFWKFEGGDRKNFNIFLISTAGYELYMEYGRKFYTDDPRYQAKMIELRNEFNQLTDIDYVLEQRENMLNKLKNLLK